MSQRISSKVETRLGQQTRSATRSAAGSSRLQARTTPTRRSLGARFNLAASPRLSATSSRVLQPQAASLGNARSTSRTANTGRFTSGALNHLGTAGRYSGHHYDNHSSHLGLSFGLNFGHLGLHYGHHGYGFGYHHYGHHYGHYSPYLALNWWWPTSHYQVPYYVNVYDNYCPPADYNAIDYGYSTADAGTVMADRPAPKVPAAESAVARHVRLGDFYFKEGRYSEAAESYLRAMSHAPEDASIHFLLADALFAMGDYHYAAYIINKALILDPGMAGATADKREFYGKAEDFAEHMKTLAAYVAEKPYDPTGHLVMGYNLKFSGKAKEAEQAFQKALEISPDNQAAKLFLQAYKEEAAAKEKASATPKEEAAK